MYRIAITGGIGSGKTAVTDYLESKGYTVIDTDRLSHEITAPGGKAIPYIREHFGDEYIMPDGSLDRALMRELVYNKPDQMAILEYGTTRVIIDDTNQIIRDCEEKGDKVVFVAIPLLFEKGNSEDYDIIWSVIADIDTRLERVKNRDNFDEQMIRNIFSIQASDEERIAKSTDIIDNSSTLEHLYNQIDILLRKYDI